MSCRQLCWNELKIGSKHDSIAKIVGMPPRRWFYVTRQQQCLQLRHECVRAEFDGNRMRNWCHCIMTPIVANRLQEWRKMLSFIRMSLSRRNPDDGYGKIMLRRARYTCYKKTRNNVMRRSQIDTRLSWCHKPHRVNSIACVNKAARKVLSKGISRRILRSHRSDAPSHSSRQNETLDTRYLYS